VRAYIVTATLVAALNFSLEANTVPPGSARADVRFKVIESDYYRKGAAALALEQIYRG
jgi:hypothetical protein